MPVRFLETYTEYHKIIGAAWRRMNEDLEFCEQLELELPRSREWHRDREWGSVHDETYFTKEALLKAVEAFKQASELKPEAPIHAMYADFLKN